MEYFKNVMIDIWKTAIAEEFKKGRIVYERQLQAEIYHQLKCRLPVNEEYEIWVEPVIYSESLGLPPTTIFKPDLVITKGDKIIAFIELKCKPWEYVSFKYDLQKLHLYAEAIQKRISDFNIPLGYKPVSKDWNNDDRSNWVQYSVSPEHINGFFVCCHSDSEAISLKGIVKLPKNLMHLVGYYEESSKAMFELKEY